MQMNVKILYFCHDVVSETRKKKEKEEIKFTRPQQFQLEPKPLENKLGPQSLKPDVSLENRFDRRRRKKVLKEIIFTFKKKKVLRLFIRDLKDL